MRRMIKSTPPKNPFDDRISSPVAHKVEQGSPSHSSSVISLKQQADFAFILQNIEANDPFFMVRNRQGPLDHLDFFTLKPHERAALIHNLVFFTKEHSATVSSKIGCYGLNYRQEQAVHLNWEKYTFSTRMALEEAAFAFLSQLSPNRRPGLSSSQVPEPAPNSTKEDRSGDQIRFVRKKIEDHTLLFPSDPFCPLASSPIICNDLDLIRFSQEMFTDLHQVVSFIGLRSGIGESIAFDFRGPLNNPISFTSHSLRLMSYLYVVSRGDITMFGPLSELFINRYIKGSKMINPLILAYTTLHQSQFVASAAHFLMQKYVESLDKDLLPQRIIETGLLVVKKGFKFFKINTTRSIHAVFGPLENVLFYFVFMFQNYHGASVLNEADRSIFYSVLEYLIEYFTAFQPLQII